MTWNGENSVVIRHEQEERRRERLAREQEAAEAEREEQEQEAAAQEPPACPKCGDPLRSFEGVTVCSGCGRTWGPR